MLTHQSKPYWAKELPRNPIGFRAFWIPKKNEPARCINNPFLSRRAAHAAARDAIDTEIQNGETY